MNPHAARSTSPFALLQSLKTNRRLILNLTKREIIGRYRGSVMGLLWSFFNPVLMLAVYTFVFSMIFKARWTGGSDSKAEFALVLFSGLMIFTLFSECINRAPSLVLGNVNYVKKVVFPLEILPIVTFGSAAFHFAASLLVWLIFYSTLFGIPHPSILLLPVMLLPLALMTLGFSWFLASLGVYLRDVTQIIGVATTVLMFLSPIFYPVDALPAQYRPFMQVNVLTYMIEQTRDLMIWGRGLHWATWVAYTLLSAIIAWLGFAWFQKTRNGFADVV